MTNFVQSLAGGWSRFHERRPRSLALVGFGLVVLFIFREVFTHGYVLDGNWDRRDQFYPFHEAARRAFQQFQLLEWNPYIFCGTSFLFSTANLSLYPANWLAYSLPQSQLALALTVLVMAHMLLSGAFSYALLHRLTNDRWCSFVFALAFMLSSSMIMNAATEATYYGLVIFPALLYLLATARTRNGPLNIALLGLGYALLIVSGVANIVIYVLAVCIAYSIYVACVDTRTGIDWKALGAATGALLLAIGVTAIRTLPFFYDAAFYLKAKTTYENFLETGLTPWACLLRLFLHHFFGDHTYPSTSQILLQDHFGRPVAGVMNNYEAFSSYIGIVPAYLAAYAFLFLWNKSTAFWKLASVATVLTVCGSPLTYVHYVVTGRTNVHFGRLSLLLPMYLVILAALAAPVVLARTRHLTRFLMFVPAVCILVLFASLMISGRMELLTGVDLQAFPFVRRSRMQLLVVSAACMGVLAFLRFCDRPWAIPATKAALAALVLGDLLFTANIDRDFSRPFLARRDEFEPHPNLPPLPDAVTGLRRLRVLALTGETQGCKSIHLDAYNISGLDQSAPAHISELYWYPDVPGRMDARSVWPNREPTMGRILQLTSTGFVITDQGILSVDKPLPRWSLYTDYVVAEDEDRQRKLVLSPDTDIRTVVVLDRDPRVEKAPERTAGTVALDREGVDEIVLQTSADVACVLLLTDTYYPGWRAYVDDVETPILRANSAFRAVALPAGDHRVRFVFRHERARLGWCLTGASLALLAATAGVGAARRRPHTPERLLGTKPRP